MGQFFLGLILFTKAPELLEKRVNHQESEREQKKVIGLSTIMFLAGFLLSALDFRFGWTQVPGIAVVLGSWIGFVIFCTYPLLLVKRIRNEEAVLEAGLAGYREYKKKVRYRMIPFVW